MQKILIDYLNSDAAKKQDFVTKLTIDVQQHGQVHRAAQLRNLSAAFSGSNKDRFYNELDKTA